MQKVEVTRRIPAPREAVWKQYTDWPSWSRWARIGKVRVDPKGRDDPNGVGAVRIISNGGISAYEEILVFQPPSRVEYRVIKGGLPMKDHHGWTLFEPDGEGTRVTWKCQFNSRVPGMAWLWGAIAGLVFRIALTGLERAVVKGA